MNAEYNAPLRLSSILWLGSLNFKGRSYSGDRRICYCYQSEILRVVYLNNFPILFYLMLPSLSVCLSTNKPKRMATLCLLQVYERAMNLATIIVH